jgi:hypothetical protein
VRPFASASLEMLWRIAPMICGELVESAELERSRGGVEWLQRKDSPRNPLFLPMILRQSPRKSRVIKPTRSLLFLTPSLRDTDSFADTRRQNKKRPMAAAVCADRRFRPSCALRTDAGRSSRFLVRSCGRIRATAARLLSLPAAQSPRFGQAEVSAARASSAVPVFSRK